MASISELEKRKKTRKAHHIAHQLKHLTPGRAVLAALSIALIVFLLDATLNPRSAQSGTGAASSPDPPSITGRKLFGGGGGGGAPAPAPTCTPIQRKRTPNACQTATPPPPPTPTPPTIVFIDSETAFIPVGQKATFGSAPSIGITITSIQFTPSVGGMCAPSCYTLDITTQIQSGTTSRKNFPVYDYKDHKLSPEYPIIAQGFNFTVVSVTPSNATIRVKKTG